MKAVRHQRRQKTRRRRGNGRHHSVMTDLKNLRNTNLLQHNSPRGPNLNQGVKSKSQYRGQFQSQRVKSLQLTRLPTRSQTKRSNRRQSLSSRVAVQIHSPSVQVQEGQVPASDKVGLVLLPLNHRAHPQTVSSSPEQ